MASTEHSSAVPAQEPTRLSPDLHIPACASFSERALIAQELHDTLLQGFFALSMQLHDAVDQLPEDFAAKPRFRNLTHLCDRVLAEGRLAIQGLRSPIQPNALGHA